MEPLGGRTRLRDTRMPFRRVPGARARRRLPGGLRTRRALADTRHGKPCPACRSRVGALHRDEHPVRGGCDLGWFGSDRGRRRNRLGRRGRRGVGLDGRDRYARRRRLRLRRRVRVGLRSRLGLRGRRRGCARVRRGRGRRVGDDGRRVRGGDRVGRRHERRRRGDACGQQCGRVDVAVRVRRQADPEVDVGLRHLGRAARPDRAHGRALGDGVALGDGDRAEVEQRDGVAVGGLERDRLAVRRQRARVADRPRGRRAHGPARIARDVDPAVLAARVRIGHDREAAEHDSVAGPGPGIRRRRGRERGEHRREKSASHPFPPPRVVRSVNIRR